MENKTLFLPEKAHKKIPLHISTEGVHPSEGFRKERILFS
jgi:hypothetical protein